MADTPQAASADPADLQRQQARLERAQQRRRHCIKCRTARSTILLRENGFCRGCFVANFAVRPRKIITAALDPLDSTDSLDSPAQHRVLVAFSGGPSSSILLELAKAHFAHASVAKVSHLVVCHIDESMLFGGYYDAVAGSRAAQRSFVRSTLDRARQDGLTAVERSLADVYGKQQHQNEHQSEHVSEHEHEHEHEHESAASCKLKALFAAADADAREELLWQMKARLLLDTADKYHCSLVLLGETMTRLAVKAVTATARGRGFTVPIESGLASADPSTGWAFALHAAGSDSDSQQQQQQQQQQHGRIRFVRPLRDTYAKEVALYSHFCGVGSAVRPSFSTLGGRAAGPLSGKPSIAQRTEQFLVGLDRGFSSTISTVSRVLNKLAFDGGSADTGQHAACSLCRMPLQPDVVDWRQNMTAEHLQREIERLHVSGTSAASDSASRLCYGCRSTVDGARQPQLLPRSLLRAAVSEYILDSDDGDDS